MTTLKTINFDEFKASGVYFIYEDTTVLPIISGSSIVKLVVGFTNQSSVFNTPVLIQTQDLRTSREIFGGINRSMERKGSFFNRILETSLSNSPVLALNLLNVNNEVDNAGTPTQNADTAQYKSFSTDPINLNGINRDKLYASYFNKERFWFPDRKHLLATRSAVDNGRILNFVNIGGISHTILLRKSNISGYDIPVSEWYQTEDENVPCFIREYDLVKDYMIDVIIIEGNYSEENYQNLSTDPVLGAYFTPNGLIVDKLDEFINLPEINVINIVTGSLIPNFKDKDGSNLYIETIINNDVRRFGLFCSIDLKELDKHETNTNTYLLDLVGHSLLNDGVSDTDFLSYKKDITENFSYSQKTSNNSDTIAVDGNVIIEYFPTYVRVTVTNSNPDFINASNVVELGTYFNGITTTEGTNAGVTISTPALEVTRVTKTTSQLIFELSNIFKENETLNSGSFVDIDTTGTVLTYLTEFDKFIIDGTSTYYAADTGTQFYTDYKNGKITNGDRINNGTTDHYIQIIETKDNLSRDILQVNLFLDTDLSIPITAGDAFAFGTTYDSDGYLVNDPNIVNFISLSGSINQRFDANFISDTVVQIDASFFDDVVLGDYLVGTAGDEDILTRIVSIKKIGSPSVTHIEITTANNIKRFNTISGDHQIERYKPIESFYDLYNLHYLPGFTIKESHMPNGTNDRMKQIYEVIWNTNIYKGLLNKNISFRYIVDTFFHGLETQSKDYLSRLALRKQTSIAILNSPSMDEFLDSDDPRFTDTPTPVDPLPTLNAKYIRDGGNLLENPDFLFTLPEEQNGASHSGFFLPGIIVDDGGDEIEVPPSGHVAVQFAQKHANGTPYASVGGVRRGTIVGNDIKRLAAEFDDDERGYFEEKGMVPLISRNGSIIIFGEATAYQKFRSVLNNIYVRDTLINIQLRIEQILFPYAFEYNNDTTRTEVVNLINTLLDPLVNTVGVLSEYQVVFDSSNNTDEVIAADSALVDVYVSFNGIIRKFFNRFTLRRSSGSVSSNGFS